MNIFDDIQDVHQRTEGWCSWTKAQTLASIVIATRPEVCCEIGCWYGKSFFPVAQALRHIGKGKAIAIDPWKAEASVSGQVNPADQDWWNRQEIHDAAFISFAQAIDRLQLSRFVEVRRVASNDTEPPTSIGLLSIDGNHGEQVLKDVERFCPRVAFGGFVVMDDLNWSGGSVEKAVHLLAALNFQELYRVVNEKECWAVFQRL